MIHEYGTWQKEKLSFAKPERQMPEELKQVIAKGFNVGALVARTYDQNRLSDPKSWQVIVEVIENPRDNYNTKKPEFFVIRPIIQQYPGTTQNTMAFSEPELILVNAAPKVASL